MFLLWSHGFSVLCMTVCSVVLCVCCQSVLLVVLVGDLSLVHGLSSRSFCPKETL